MNKDRGLKSRGFLILEEFIMELVDAIEIVLGLAENNVIEIYPGDGQDVADERNRQLDAIAIVHDFAVNHLGDD